MKKKNTARDLSDEETVEDVLPSRLIGSHLSLHLGADMVVALGDEEVLVELIGQVDNAKFEQLEDGDGVGVAVSDGGVEPLLVARLAEARGPSTQLAKADVDVGLEIYELGDGANRVVEVVLERGVTRVGGVAEVQDDSKVQHHVLGVGHPGERKELEGIVGILDGEGDDYVFLAHDGVADEERRGLELLARGRGLAVLVLRGGVCQLVVEHLTERGEGGLVVFCETRVKLSEDLDEVGGADV